MCPNSKDPENKICPGILGTHHPLNTICEFTLNWYNSKHEQVWIHRYGDSYVPICQAPNKNGAHRQRGKGLDGKGSYDEAQEALNKYALEHNWMPI
jgi:hypothetical protein